MIKKLIIRPEAEIDIAQAAMWYEEERPGLGLRFLAEVDHVFDRIETKPLMFPRVQAEVRRALLRRFPYSVYFTMEPAQTVVFAVLHFRRNPVIWKERISPGND